MIKIKVEDDRRIRALFRVATCHIRKLNLGLQIYFPMFHPSSRSIGRSSDSLEVDITRRVVVKVSRYLSPILYICVSDLDRQHPRIWPALFTASSALITQEHNIAMKHPAVARTGEAGLVLFAHGTTLL